MAAALADIAAASSGNAGSVMACSAAGGQTSGLVVRLSPTPCRALAGGGAGGAGGIAAAYQLHSS